jgi:hypothetical protein
MFVRFRQKADRLQVSLIETRRANGMVRHEHVASLGAIATPPTIADRIAFWQRSHERLAKLSNRVTAEQHAKVLGAIHKRVPMVTADEQRDLQRANAEADAQFWDGIADVYADTVEDHEGLVAFAESKIANMEAQRADAAENAAKAKDRIARLERGETVEGGLGKPMTAEDAERICRAAGMTASDLRHAQVLAALPEAAIPLIVQAAVEGSDRAAKRTARKLLAYLLAKLDDDDDAPVEHDAA